MYQDNKQNVPKERERGRVICPFLSRGVSLFIIKGSDLFKYSLVSLCGISLALHRPRLSLHTWAAVIEP